MHITTLMNARGAKELTGPGAMKRRRAAMLQGVKKTAAEMERHHKRKEMVRRGASLSGAGTHPTKLTARTNTLSRSYSVRIDKNALLAGYGSDARIAPVHEFGATIRTSRYIAKGNPTAGTSDCSTLTKQILDCIAPRVTIFNATLYAVLLGLSLRIVSSFQNTGPEALLT